MVSREQNHGARPAGASLEPAREALPPNCIWGRHVEKVASAENRSDIVLVRNAEYPVDDFEAGSRELEPVLRVELTKSMSQVPVGRVEDRDHASFPDPSCKTKSISSILSTSALRYRRAR